MSLVIFFNCNDSNDARDVRRRITKTGTINHDIEIENYNDDKNINNSIHMNIIDNSNISNYDTPWLLDYSCYGVHLIKM